MWNGGFPCHHQSVAVIKRGARKKVYHHNGKSSERGRSSEAFFSPSLCFSLHPMSSALTRFKHCGKLTEARGGKREMWKDFPHQGALPSPKYILPMPSQLTLQSISTERKTSRSGSVEHVFVCECDEEFLWYVTARSDSFKFAIYVKDVWWGHNDCWELEQFRINIRHDITETWSTLSW